MKKIALCGCAAMLVLFCVSCGSKPVPEETKTPEPPKVEEKQPEPEPEPEPTPAPVVVKVDNTIALKGIDESRKLALENDVENYAEEELAAVDKIYESIKAKSDEGKDVSAEAKDLANRYAALSAYVSALKALEKIDDTDMVYVAYSLYEEGYNALEEYEALVADPNSTGQAQLDAATNASISLNSALALVYKKITKEERTDAFVAKKNADSVKAAVAQKTKYDQGVEYFKKGDSLYSMQSLDKAYENYKKSKEIFNALYNDISEKRAAVEKAIEEAKRKVNESAEFAIQADKKAPLREMVAGIEDEDAVLLEEDDYDDPSDAEAELPEDIEDPAKKLIKSVLGDAK